jgi:amidase
MPSATDIADMVKRGLWTASEVTEECIRRAEVVQPGLNAIVTRTYDRARANLSPPGSQAAFAGVPFLVKDLTEVRGVKTRHGSRSTVNQPAETWQGPLVTAYETAGLTIIGKSATPEFGLLPTTEPLGFSPTRNPWNIRRSTGGSSGGAAAAVAAGVMPMAHGSDGGGSLRIPAACCGVFGLKPSRGRMIGSTDDGATDVTVEHAITRTVKDSATLFSLTERLDIPGVSPVGLVSGRSSRRLRIGIVYQNNLVPVLTARIRQAVFDTAQLLSRQGHKIVEAAWPVDAARFTQDFAALWGAGANYHYQETSASLGRPATSNDLDGFTLGLKDRFRKLSGSEMGAAMARLEADAQSYANWFNSFDVMLSPVLSALPMPLGQLAPSVPYQTLLDRVIAYAPYTAIHNVAGAPAMSVPMAWAPDGTPIGVQVSAARFQERTLFELAYELEALQPWAYRRPPIWAA